jgi:GT2 family glycosyltransferase/glycosyltransferase involved in cell wall biosynthesis
MRILVIVHTFPPASEAGSEIYARDLARALHRRHGDQVLVIARESDAARDEYSVRIDRCDELTVAWINNTFAVTRGFEDSYRNERLGAIAERIVDDFSPDVAHIHHLTCLSTAIPEVLSARRIPIVLTLHDYWLMCHRGQLLDRDGRVCEGPGSGGCGNCIGPEAGIGAMAQLRATVPVRAPAALVRRVAPLVSSPAAAADQERRRIAHMRDMCAHITRFLAPSRAIGDRFVAFGVPAGRMAVSPYGFDRAPFRNVPRTTSTRLRLGFLGSMMISKAPHVLLQAASRLPSGSVSVDFFGPSMPYHGDDGYRSHLTALSSAEHVRVHGAIPHARVADVLASLDVLVVPSIWPENSPLVIGEAFMAGVPVVASRTGGIPEVVDEGRNGLLFAPGDAEDLARVLATLVNDRVLLSRLRDGAASTRVRSIEDDAEGMRRLYTSLIGGRAAPLRPRVAAVVLNYRAADDTFLAVASLRASHRAIDDIIVVDNDSSDKARAALADVAPHIRYIRSPRNLGYPGGMNLGIREALLRGADRVLLVNSDVVVPPDCVERLEHSIESTPGAGIAGPLVVARSDPDFVASTGMSYHPSSGRMRHDGFGGRADRTRRPAAGIVDGVSGCLMLVTREVFDAIGPLEEDYFFSFEDLDFCLRARRAGFSTVLAGMATVHHEGGRSIGARSPRRLYFAARGHLLLARRAGPHGGPLGSIWRTGAIVALNVAHAVRSSGAPLPVRLAAVARGVRDYFAGRFGPDGEAGG